MKSLHIKTTSFVIGVSLALAMFANEPKATVSSGESLLADLSPAEKVESNPTTEPLNPVAEAPKPAAEAPKPTVETEAASSVEAAKPAPEAKPAEAEKPAEAVKPVEAAKSALEAKPVEEEKTAEKTQAAETETDEIDLNVDDSAEAAKGRPVVKLAPPDAKPTAADPIAAGPVKESVAPDGVVPPTLAATGTDIAAKFLASDETALVDIMSDDATLTDILRQFRKATGANIIYAESTNLQQRVSVSLKHVPWLQAMRSILNSRGFRVESSGGIHFVKEDKLVDPVFTRTFQLNHASVDELAKLFNENYGLKDKNGKLIHGIATPFSGANTVVVTAPDRVLADCEAIIKAVDKAVPQIYIEARFIELSNQAMHKLGLQWNQLESWGASVKDLNGGMEYSNGRLNKFKNGYTDTYYTPKRYVQTGSGDAAKYEDMSDGRSALDYRTQNYLVPDEIASPTRLSDGANVADIAWRNARVFSGQLSADDFRLAMSAFEQLEDTKIFSNPKVIVSNGKEALFDRTTKFPHITLTSQHDTQSGYTKSDAKLEIIPGEDELFSKKKTAFFSWGITLTVKPRISPDGLISVEIVPSISDLQFDASEGGTESGFYSIYGGSDAPYGRYPIILFKRLTTEFTMKDGATAVIGGLSKTEEGDVDSGIPYLRKIPWIGPKLFGWKSRGKVQKEILIFVTVGIADPANLPEDVGLPKNAVRGREYVEKRAFEPGDRPNAANEVLKLDMRLLDEQAKDREKENAEAEAKKNDDDTHGTVVITPVAPEKE